MKSGDLPLLIFVLAIAGVGIVIAMVGRIRSDTARWGGMTPPQDISDTVLQTDPQIQRMNADATTILAGLKRVCGDFHLDFRGPDNFHAETGRTTYTPYDTPKVELGTKDCQFTFEQASGNLASYLLWSHAFTATPAKDPTEPKWTNDEVLKIALAIRHVLVDDSKFTFSTPKAQYTPSFGTGENYHEGDWWVYWTRVDAKGRPFGGNGVQLRLSETVGVTSATTYLADTYDEQEGQPMTSDQAVALAKKNHPAFGTESKTIVDYTLKSADLELIRPYGNRRKPCRLAWVIWLQPVRAKGTPFLGYDDSQELTIDAFTGTIMGHDAMM